VTLDCEVVQSRSGVPAMRDRNSGELMHPVVGPRVEAARVYIEPSRLAERLCERHGAPDRDPLVLLDAGLGAGSNAIAAWQLSESLELVVRARRLSIVSFDRSLDALALALRAEHRAAFGFAEGGPGQAAQALLEHGCHETERTSWRLQQGDLRVELARQPAASADIVFWDPFSLRANPDLWTLAAFSAARRATRDRATLHTYSGATSVRSALLLAGFAVGVGEAVSTRKYGTCAALRHEDLQRPLDRRWLDRLSRSCAPLPVDAPPRDQAFEQIESRPQFQLCD
jgi:queuine tRNA-ribosyltransferase